MSTKGKLQKKNEITFYFYRFNATYFLHTLFWSIFYLTAKKMAMTNSFARTHSFISNHYAFLLFKQWRGKTQQCQNEFSTHCYKSFCCKSIRPFRFVLTERLRMAHVWTAAGPMRSVKMWRFKYAKCCLANHLWVRWMHVLVFVHSTAFY